MAGVGLADDFEHNRADLEDAALSARQADAFDKKVRTPDCPRQLGRARADPAPLRWTKSADAILASIERFCQRTLNVQAAATVGGWEFQNRDTRADSI